MGTMTIKGKTMRSVDVDWNEFYYTNCPLVSPSNVDQEIGRVREKFKKISRTDSCALPPRTTGIRTTFITSTT